MFSGLPLIAKNTLFLYIRHILILFVNLITVRIVLDILGVEDYGTFIIVSGAVALFLFFNEALTSSTERFISYAIGKNDIAHARNTYSTLFIFHFSVSILLIILAQTLGIWLFSSFLNIPNERLNAAYIVFQFSVFTSAVFILQAPYHATIIAYEKMSFFTLLSIFESIFKLIIIIALRNISFDKLILYSFILLVISILKLMVYKLYCNRSFEISRFKFIKDKFLITQIIKFTGWNLFTGVANTSRTHGINLLVNIFFNVTVNTALGLAMQVRAAVYAFARNFQSAFRPQIIKSYASNNISLFMQLIFQTTRASYFLLFFFILPLYLNIEFVLQLWLKNVPEYTVVFTKIILLASLLEAISNPLVVSINATGNIKNLTLFSSLIIFLNLPISYIFLKLGYEPKVVLIIKAFLLFTLYSWLIYYSTRNINLKMFKFLKQAILPLILVSIISFPITFYISNLFIGWAKLIITCFTSSISIILLVYFFGVTSEERVSLKNWVRKFIFQYSSSKIIKE